MTDADVIVDPGDAELDPLSRAFIESETAHATAKKNVTILHEYSKRVPRATSPDRAALPRFAGRDPRLGAGRGHPHLPQRADRGRLRRTATASGPTTEEIVCGLVFRSIGYRGTPLEGLPFDERHAVIPNDGGRVIGDDGRCRASTSSAGSSAGRRASSARTSATPRRPST